MSESQQQEAQISLFLGGIQAMILEEIGLLTLQIEKSRKLRNASLGDVQLSAEELAAAKDTAELIVSPICEMLRAISATSTPLPPSESATLKSPQAKDIGSVHETNNNLATPVDAPPSLSLKDPFDQMMITPEKGGTLLLNGKDRLLRTFAPYYVVASSAGMFWFSSQSQVKSAPVDGFPFVEMESNSRGSSFARACVCWPMVMEDDCPKASDRSKVYFGVDYFNPKTKKNELVTFGAATALERDEWVFFITRFVKLYIPATRPEYIAFGGMRVGSKTPLYVSKVLGGEAPGSGQRTI